MAQADGVASRRAARKLGDLITERSKQLAEIEVRDNGKLYAEMSMQTAYGAVVSLLRWPRRQDRRRRPSDRQTRHLQLHAIRTARRHRRDRPVELAAAADHLEAAPALAAGNTVVIKPSEFTSASVLEFMKLIEDAGFPPGVVNVVTGFGADVGAPLVEHPLVAKVAFTGSDVTGQRIYEAAARGLKHVTMELGGKSPNIVFDDAEIDNAVKGRFPASSRRLARRASPDRGCSCSRASMTSFSTSSSRSPRRRRWGTRCTPTRRSGR